MTRTDSRKTATPCMGSAQRGPCKVESWKAWVILSEKEAGLREEGVFCSGVSDGVVLSFRLEVLVLMIWEGQGNLQSTTYAFLGGINQ